MSKLEEYDGPILEIDKLSISFFTRLREIPAVMDFSVAVQPGEAVGLVGEIRLRQIHRGAGRDAGSGQERTRGWWLDQVQGS